MHIYDRLQVRSVINAYETISMVGGTRMREEVLQAMIQATERFVHIPELQEKAGVRLAQLTKNEAAIVTNGALAGLVLAAAACIAKFDKNVLHSLQLPSAREFSRGEIIVQRCQYTPYTVNLRQIGARIVEIGYAQNPTPSWHLQAAISDRTAAVFYSVGKPYERNAIPLQTVVEIAHSYDIPVFVDAASSLPPVERLWQYTGLGVDLVAFSGGKGIRGPQDTGLVVGKRNLVDTIASECSPHHGIGRTMKSSKEDIIGLLVAVEAFLSEDHIAQYTHLKVQAQWIAEELAKFPGVEVWVVPDGRQGQAYPRTVVKLLPESDWSREDLTRALRDGDPSIVVGDMDEDPNAIYINPMNLSKEEGEIVTRRISQLISRAALK